MIYNLMVIKNLNKSTFTSRLNNLASSKSIILIDLTIFYPGLQQIFINYAVNLLLLDMH